MKPVVSVCMLTYNHQHFIGQAIESVIAQKVDFPVELVIGEDFSSDKTREICEKYSALYPELVKLLPKAAHNLGSQKNFINTFSNCKGKYVAMLEGDDFWSDPLKLQTQVDFLENNLEFVLSFHDITVIDEKGEEADDKRLPVEKKRDYDKNELLLGHYLPTPTTIFRNFEISEHIPLFQKTIYGDTLLQSILTQKGKVKYFEDIAPSFIRVHSGGIWSSKSYLEKWNWSIKTSVIIYNMLNKDLKCYTYESIIKSFEMAAWDADSHGSKKYWFKFNFRYLLYLLFNANKYGRGLLIAKRIGKRVLAI